MMIIDKLIKKSIIEAPKHSSKQNGTRSTLDAHIILGFM